MSNRIILTNDNKSIKYLKSKDKRLSKVIDEIGSIEYFIHDDPYSFLVHEIIEQMLSKKAGQKIYERLVNKCNGNVTPSKVSKLNIEDLRNLGISYSKSNYILNLTNAVINKDIVFNELEKMSDIKVKEKLMSVYGIGEWTSQMYLIFVLNRNDVLPVKDTAFIQSYKWLYKTNNISSREVIKKCKKWKPYSSIASRYLYKALDEGLTKKEFHLFK